MTPAFMRFLVILVLVLYLTSDQCHGFTEDLVVCKRELCRKLPNTEPSPANNGSFMAPSKSATFSCGDCIPGIQWPVICDDCKTKPGQASKESDTDTGCHINFDF